MFGEIKFRPPRLAKSLSARLLVLTIFFVMLAELLIYAPSLANFRQTWLEDKLAAAHLSILSLEAIPEDMISDEVKEALLTHVDAHAVVLKKPDRRLLLYTKKPPTIEVTVDLEDRSSMMLIGDAFATLVQSRNRIMRLLGPSPRDPGLGVEVVLDEADLRTEMLVYSRNILLLSLAISIITAGLLYLSLQWLMVRPMRRVTQGVTDFAANPEDSTTGIKPTGRGDEIGVIQSVLVEMQNDVRSSLRQKAHLAALGSAVSKINHDLRGILSTAVLISDRLATLDNPVVKRLTPPLVQAIDRAIALCTQTLDFARDEGPELHTSRFRLRELVDDVSSDIDALGEGRSPVENTVGEDMIVEADRDQLYRVFSNLARNAFEAGAYRVSIGAANGMREVLIDVHDDGPGLPRQARDSLFKPFAGSARRGGTGLGLVIARDVMRAHGGDIDLTKSGSEGTTFRLRLPLQD